jgi:hypothetical protein
MKEILRRRNSFFCHTPPVSLLDDSSSRIVRQLRRTNQDFPPSNIIQLRVSVLIYHTRHISPGDEQ